MNRRGSLLFGDDMVRWIFRAVILTIMVVILGVFAGLVFSTSVDIRLAETRLIINSVVYSPSGLVFSENGRAYPGIVDLERFKPESIDAAFHSEQQYWGYNLTLFNASMKPIKNIVGNPDWYKRWLVLAGTGLPGSGSAIRLIDTFYVRIQSPEGSKPGFLRVDVTRPRT